MIKNLKIAMLGFGDAGQAFAKLLIDKRQDIIAKYKCDPQVVAISTRSRGSIVNETGIDLKSVLLNMKDLNKFDDKREDYSTLNSIEIAQTVD